MHEPGDLGLVFGCVESTSVTGEAVELDDVDPTGGAQTYWAYTQLFLYISFMIVDLSYICRIAGPEERT
jgi:hypothetical protein